LMVLMVNLDEEALRVDKDRRESKD
jgi:hypothetical protein